MVENSKGMISPSLSRQLRDYSIANDVAISREVVSSAVDFLKNHTDLSQLDIDQAVGMAVKSVHKKGANSNYEGTDTLDPKSFGKEVILVCTENGIKIKRVPKDVEEEVKDKFENMDGDVLDSTYTILNMQPDLCPEDRGKVVMTSLLDTLNDGESFDGEMDYVAFGQHIRKNLGLVRKEKEKEKAVDKLIDIFTGEDNYEGSIHEAFEHLDDIHNFKDDDFARYFDDVLTGGHSGYDGGNDYMSKAHKEKKEIRKEKKVDKKEIRQEKKAAIKSGVSRKEARQGAKVAKKEIKLEAKAAIKDVNKERRKEHGSRIANLLTGGVVGVHKRLKAKKEAKKEKAAAAAALNQTSTDIINQEAPIDPSLMQMGTDLQGGAAQAPDMPAPSGGGGGGGGGGDDQGEMGGEDEGEDGGEDTGEAEDSNEEADMQARDQEMQEEQNQSSSIGDTINAAQEAQSEAESEEEEEDQPEESEEDTEEDVDELDEEEGQGNYVGAIKKKDGWYPEHESNPEIAKFFGYIKEEKKESEPLSVALGLDSFMGSENIDNNTWKWIGVAAVIGVIVFVYLKYKR